ncbi:MAG: peptidoglycan DD-metalloendopeptidase family protein [Gammaproteobacteria bacterium]|nr:peptidoglycan DD-metalloendopeptidase family protein [Gammaproteobacteria bacterium]
MTRTHRIVRNFPGHRLWSGLVAAMLMLWLPVLSAQPPASTPSEEQARQQLEVVSNAISSIEQWLQETRRQRSGEEAALAALDQQLAEIEAGITQNQTRQLALQAEIQRLDADIAPLLAESEAQRAELARAVEASYLAGADSQLKLLLNQQDPAIAQRMLVYFEAFNQERLQQINRWLVTITALRQAQSDLAASAEQLEATNAVLREQQNSLAIRQNERVALISNLTAGMAARGTELSRLQEDRDGLQALIEQINRVIDDIPELEDLTPFTGSRGNMPWPVAGELLAGYGQTYSNGQLRRQGIIIAAEAGSPVRAIHPGRVVFSDWLRGSGNLVVVDHGDSYISLYAHNQQLIKTSGDWVNRGEALALSGIDGGSGEPGIYFEIRRNSETVNPVEWLE